MRTRDVLIKYALLSPVICILVWVALGPIIYFSHFLISPDAVHTILLISCGLGMYGWIFFPPMMNKYKEWKEIPDSKPTEDEATIFLLFLVCLIMTLGFYSMTVSIVNPVLSQPWWWMGATLVSISLVLGVISVGARIAEE